MEAKDSCERAENRACFNASANSLNEHEYSSEIERLKLELQHEHERVNGLEIAKKTLEEKLDEMNAKLDASAQREQQLINKATIALNSRHSALSPLNQEYDANTVFRNSENQALTFIDNKPSELNLTTAATEYRLITMRRPYIVQKLRDRRILTRHQSLYNTICCKCEEIARALRRHVYNKAEDKIVLRRASSNSLNLSRFMKRRLDPNIVRRWILTILILIAYFIITVIIGFIEDRPGLTALKILIEVIITTLVNMMMYLRMMYLRRISLMS